MKKFVTMFLLGQYGAGKDTHGPFIANHFGLKHLSFSAFLKQDTTALTFIEKGLLVPDHEVFRIFGSSSLDRLLFNGFPRTVEQLHFIAQKCPVHEIALVYLDVHDAIAIKRMENRLVCSVCGTATSLLKGHKIGDNCKNHPVCEGILERRSDDMPESIARRMTSFREKTFPVIQEAENLGIQVYKILISEEFPIKITQNMIGKILFGGGNLLSGCCFFFIEK